MTRIAIKWFLVLTLMCVTAIAADTAIAERAQKGDAGAQFELGAMYATGRGVPKDSVEAVKWFRMAAEQGNAKAQMLLGYMYASGQGVPQNYTESVRWYLKSAEQGNAAAQRLLGECYQYGRGIDRDYTLSLKWLRLAVEQGDAEAIRAIGIHYIFGQGVAQDTQEALKYIRQAAERGSVRAQTDLGSGLRTGRLPFLVDHKVPFAVVKNLPEALKWYRMAAEQGDVEGQEGLGDMYAEGEAVSKNGVEAVKWYRMAAEQGSFTAPYALGQIYRNGEIVQKNGAEAVRWYRKACETSTFPSAESLGYMYSIGDGVLKDEIEGLAWAYIAAATGTKSSLEMREILERSLGREVSLLAQQRSKEILKELEAAKQKKTTPAARSSIGHFVPDYEIPKASGSGAIVSAEGHVLTAAHVVAGATSVRIHTILGMRNATVLRVDEANDIAVLKLDNGVYPAIPVGLSRKVRLGQTVATIGFPNIGFQGFSPKVTKGEISSLNGFGDDPRSWQISVPVQPGNSGGALLDESGNLIGVVVSKLGLKAAQATGDIPQNVNYAVKSTYALALLEPYMDSNAPGTNQGATKPRFEDMIAKAQQSVVLILVY